MNLIEKYHEYLRLDAKILQDIKSCTALLEWLDANCTCPKTHIVNNMCVICMRNHDE